MANYQLDQTGEEVQAILDAVQDKETTRPVLNSSKLITSGAVRNALAEGYLYKGVADHTTHPGTPTEKVFYIASDPGTYYNFGTGISVAEGEVAILKYDTAWHKEVTGAATAAQVTELGPTNDGIVNKAIKKIFIDTSNYSGSVDISSGLKITRLFNNNNGKYGIRLANGNGVTIEDWTITQDTPILCKRLGIFVYIVFDYDIIQQGGTIVDAALSNNAYLYYNDPRPAIKDWVMSESYNIQSLTKDANGDISSANVTFYDGATGVLSFTRDSSGEIIYVDCTYNSIWSFLISIIRDSNGDVIRTASN